MLSPELIWTITKPTSVIQHVSVVVWKVFRKYQAMGQIQKIQVGRNRAETKSGRVLNLEDSEKA